MLQSEMAEKLQKRKVEHIESVQPQVVAAGNIGCMEQIGRATGIPDRAYCATVGLGNGWTASGQSADCLTSGANAAS